MLGHRGQRHIPAPEHVAVLAGGSPHCRGDVGPGAALARAGGSGLAVESTGTAGTGLAAGTWKNPKRVPMQELGRS